MSASSTGGTWAGDVTSRRISNQEDAWRELYAAHEVLARRFLLRLGVPNEALDDACKEVFLHSFRYLKHFKHDSTFTTWLYRSCSREARKKRIRLKLYSVLLGFMSTRPTHAKDPTGTSATRETENINPIVRTALNRLSNKERLVFVLYEFEGQNGREIAAVAGCSEARVWRTLHTARKLFRDHIEDHGGEL